MSNVYTTNADAEIIVQRLHAGGWLTDELRDELLDRAQTRPRPDDVEIERIRNVFNHARLLVEGETWPVCVPAEALAFTELHAQGLCSGDEADKWWTDEFMKRAREREQ